MATQDDENPYKSSTDDPLVWIDCEVGRDASPGQHPSH